MRSEHAAHFGSEAARETAAHLGMWIFLVSEVLLFTVMFTAYALYRADYSAVFHLGRRQMAVGLGTANTYLLVSSSVVVALAVKHRSHRVSALLLGVAVLFGAAFLTIKGVEYAQHIHEGALPGARYHLASLQEPGASLFFSLYWLMTAVHALHVLVGMGVLATLAVLSWNGRPRWLEQGGMYWHLVDVIWLFLWPLFYLV
ncbi:MAG: cytochrome c oxidase subunit 3 [Myxococcaceae bacterium]